MAKDDRSSPLGLHQLVHDFARGIELADSRRPQAVSSRSGAAYRPGIGPHSETATVALVIRELEQLAPAIEAFEVLASRATSFSPREEASFSGLVHPVHRSGAVFGWELRGSHGSHPRS